VNRARIAFWAHIGGFAAGLLVMRVFVVRRRSRDSAA
jgi:membrane associated rhomboid family serine protease